MEEEKIRICLKSFDYCLIDQTCAEIVNTAKKTGATVSGPIPLPTRRHRYCVLRSPHVNKKSREIFDLCVHKRLIDICISKRTIDNFYDMSVSSGVHLEIKIKTD